MSALLTQGDPNIIAAHPVAGDPSLEERVAATLSAELVAAITQQGGPPARVGRRLYDDLDPEGEDEDELEDDPYESGPERAASPRYRRRGRGSPPAAMLAEANQGEKGGQGGELQVMIVEGLDGEAFPIPLRARKGKETVGAPAVVSGVKRKR